jgi:hypothetical protein
MIKNSAGILTGRDFYGSPKGDKKCVTNGNLGLPSQNKRVILKTR